MKKLNLFLALAAVAVGFTSCEDDQTGPVLQAPEAGSFTITAPSFAATGITLNADSLLTINFPQQPAYGFDAAVDYTLNLALSAGDNAQKMVINPEETTVKSITVKQSDMATAICELLGVESMKDWTDAVSGPRSVFVSVNAQLGTLASTAVTSNVVELKNVVPYFAASAYYLWTPGNSNEWNQGASQTLFSTDNVTFTGFAYLDGEFKFTSQPNWDGINYGQAKEEDVIKVGVLSTDGGAGNISVDKKGLYYCTVDIKKLTYKLQYIEHVSVIGDATPGGWDTDTQLTPSDNYMVWSADVDFHAGSFKYRLNDSWDFNYGGDLNGLSQGGDNIGWDNSGMVTVSIDFSGEAVTGSVVAK